MTDAKENPKPFFEQHLKKTRSIVFWGARLSKRAVAALLLALPLYLSGQRGFEDKMDFKQIQELLADAIDKKDVYRQGLGWYKWAVYRENETSNRDSAFQYYAKSVEFFWAARDTLAYHRARAELATHMAERGLVNEAFQIQREALDFFKRKGEKRLETLALVQLGRLYQSIGDTAQASLLHQEFSEKARLLKDTLLLINVYMDEVVSLQGQYDYQNAIPLAFRVLELSKQLGRTEFVAWAEYRIAYFNEMLGDHYMAIRFLDRAEQSNPPSDAGMRYKIYQLKASTYASMDSLQKAVYYAQMCIKLGDTLLDRDRILASNRLAVEFGDREKLQKIKEMQVEKGEVELSKRRQRDFFYVLLLFFGAIILALIFMVRDYRHRLYTNRVNSQQMEKINQQTIRELEDNLKIETMQSMLEGQESERRRVAHDLHDSLGGLLAATKMRLDNLSEKVPKLSGNEEFVKIKGLLDDTIAETRQIARNLQPGTLHQFGLMKALRDLTGRVQGDGVPVIDFQHFGDFSNIDHTIALNCYRIVQELLQNSLKHARATEILVQLTRTENELALLVEDNGVGYDPVSIAKGMGTDNVAQRVQFLKGEISIQSAEGQGTSTMVTVPVG